MSSLRLPIALLALASLPLLTRAWADDRCATFSWDVRHERELFSKEPIDLASGRALADAPQLSPDRLYELELRAQPEVTFVTPPSRTWPQEATYAGLARLTVETAGIYRFSLDQPGWIDVVANGTLLRSRDSEFRNDCSTPNKLVEFALPAGKPLVLEFSSAVTPSIKFTLTRSPAQSP